MKGEQKERLGHLKISPKKKNLIKHSSSLMDFSLDSSSFWVILRDDEPSSLSVTVLVSIFLT